MRSRLARALAVVVVGCGGGGGKPAPSTPDGNMIARPPSPDAGATSAPSSDAPVAADRAAGAEAAAAAAETGARDVVTPAPDARAGGDAAVASWWRPMVGSSWDWQLQGPVDPSADVAVYDIDLFNNGVAAIAGLHAKGRKVICYVNLGAWENWRPDAAQFPKAVIGAVYDGFPNENWLDIRRIDLLTPIVRARLDMARAKGCDGVEPDNMDGYDTSSHATSGFPLTYNDQIAYNRFLAAEAHARGLAVGLKNDINQVKDLVPDFDFMVSEQCFQYKECDRPEMFVTAGKPVFECEYEIGLDQFCAQAAMLHISAIKKRPALDAFRQACP